ncbi:hypothetical protein H8356DRAFT_1653928 [Neocallimastix lanati (nom. inval.)]|nr:hypothetical protein H8356DRAFT_1653928 [Neocallimastix sp. JGI-2020a]
MARRENYGIRSVIWPNINIPIDTVLLPKKACDNLNNVDSEDRYKNNDMILLNRQST